MAVHFCISNPCPLCHPAGSYPAASAPFGGAERYWEGRWRDERAHNDALVKALEQIRDDMLCDPQQVAEDALIRVGQIRTP
jgi:hypothetical protein